MAWKHYGFRAWNEEALKQSESIGNECFRIKDEKGLDEFLRLIGNEVKDPHVLNDEIQVTIQE